MMGEQQFSKTFRLIRQLRHSGTDGMIMCSYFGTADPRTELEHCSKQTVGDTSLAPHALLGLARSGVDS